MKAPLTAALAACLAALCLAAAGNAGAGSETGAAAGPGPLASTSAAAPASTYWPIPFGPKRKREMAAYSRRHYGEYEWRLRDPRVIVEHVAQTPDAASIHNVFAPDVADVELGELPNVCSHFAIGPDGRIFKFVNLRTRCRHTVGLNWTAIGIEHAGYADSDVLGRRGQLRASLRLTHYLRCRFGIPVRDVIGHAESLSSPYHRERVPRLRTQTHGDFKHASMAVYRKKLRRLGRC